MALVLENVQTSTSLTVTKPTGLSVGDLMIAHCAGSNAADTTFDNHTLNNWTVLATDVSRSGSATHRATALWKVATAGDVAASDFTFNSDVDAESSCAAIYRFSGAAVEAGVLEPGGAADDDPSTTSTHTFVNTLTPLYANSVLLLLVSCVNNGGTTWSNYAITTSNPTWTEQYDITNTAAAGDGDTTMAGASATRPEITATGNSTADTGASVTDSVGLIVAIYPQVDVTVSPAVISITSSVQAPAVAAGATVSPSVISIISSVQAPTVAVSNSKWINVDKNTVSVTNVDKS